MSATRILIVTDAWAPQVNGVVRTLEYLCAELRGMDRIVETITPDGFCSLPMPTYAEIRLAFATRKMLARRIDAFGPDRIHIATEGPLGIAARSACIKSGRAFSTSYHTRFPEYLHARAPVPVGWTYALLKRFHQPAFVCLVATRSISDDLAARGFENTAIWTRGVDRKLFRPMPGDNLVSQLGLTRPVFANVGRVSVEKNLEAFLDLDLPGSKLVVGDGPARASLERKYPQARFVGTKSGEELARHHALVDVFVFPSLTDTFGNVMLEALACGVPVAAFPVPGPLDVIADSGAGVLDRDLRKAALAALEVSKEKAFARAGQFTWGECARIFLEADKPRPHPAKALA